MLEKYFVKHHICFIFIVLFVLVVNTSTINATSFINNSSLIINNNQKKISSDNSTICGYVTDIETLEPIYYANMNFYIQDVQGNQYDFEALSNETGFYIIENVVAGWCFEYGVYADGYHFYWSGNFYILENETVWVNFSMCPYQPETSQVRGYIYDNHTGNPIFNATIYMIWSDIHWQLSYNGTNSDENGFFSINLGAGRFIVYTDLDGYINQGVGWINISDYETSWMNFSLNPEIIIEITKPQNRIYYKNKMIFPFYFPLIIGPVDIEINISLLYGNPIDHVEILIDNTSKYNFTTGPYIYHWNERTLFRFRHTIEIIVHRNYDSDAYKKLLVWKFF